LTVEERNNMDKAIMIEVENLRRAGVAGLKEKSRELFQKEARSRHREHLFRKIVWRLQAFAEGDLSERARARAHEIANDASLRVLAPRGFFSVGRSFQAFKAKSNMIPVFRWSAPYCGGVGRGAPS
jgi:hypothetical protein